MSDTPWGSMLRQASVVRKAWLLSTPWVPVRSLPSGGVARMRMVGRLQTSSLPGLAGSQANMPAHPDAHVRHALGQHRLSPHALAGHRDPATSHALYSYLQSCSPALLPVAGHFASWFFGASLFPHVHHLLRHGGPRYLGGWQGVLGRCGQYGAYAIVSTRWSDSSL